MQSQTIPLLIAKNSIINFSSRIILSVALVILAFATFSIQANAGSVDDSPLVVLKRENSVYIKSAFSPEEDVVTQMSVHPDTKHMIFGYAWLVPVGMSMEDAVPKRAEWSFQAASGDVAAWCINGTLIGASNGANEAVRVSAPSHGLSTSDLGSRWTDGAGTLFFLVGIPDADSLQFLSENKATAPSWEFVTSVSGDTLKRDDGSRSISISNAERTQFYPANRIQSQQFLADGKPLEDGTVTPCSRFEVVDTYDILNPASVLDYIGKHTGKAPDLSSKEIKSLLTNRITYQFQPHGTCVINLEATANQDFDIDETAFVQASALYGVEGGDQATLSYLIPKTLLFTQDNVDYDFDGIQNMSQPLAGPLSFSTELFNLSDPNDLPDRFIQILGQGDKKIGFVIGYSLLNGMTIKSKRAENVSLPLSIHPSRHIYPVAISRKVGRIHAGEKLNCVSYRQYFLPEETAGATCIYGHQEKDAYVLYAEFHKDGDRIFLPFPANFTGKKFEIVEKSPSVTVLSRGVIERDGVSVSVKGGRGSIVLKVASGGKIR